MFDPVTFVLAAVLLLSMSIYAKAKRRRARAREFDGGFAHENERRVITILCDHIIKVERDGN
jgi:hypothetical protein